MDNEVIINQDKRLMEIGAIFYNMGITTIEKAIKLRDHLANCSGGKHCLEKLLKEEE